MPCRETYGIFFCFPGKPVIMAKIRNFTKDYVLIIFGVKKYKAFIINILIF